LAGAGDALRANAGENALVQDVRWVRRSYGYW
jgi:hypothetical protein